MNKSDEDTVVDVANVEWGVYKMHHLITELTTYLSAKKRGITQELWPKVAK